MAVRVPDHIGKPPSGFESDEYCVNEEAVHRKLQCISCSCVSICFFSQGRAPYTCAPTYLQIHVQYVFWTFSLYILCSSFLEWTHPHPVSGSVIQRAKRSSSERSCGSLAERSAPFSENQSQYKGWQLSDLLVLSRLKTSYPNQGSCSPGRYVHVPVLPVIGDLLKWHICAVIREGNTTLIWWCSLLT